VINKLNYSYKKLTYLLPPQVLTEIYLGEILGNPQKKPKVNPSYKINLISKSARVRQGATHLPYIVYIALPENTQGPCKPLSGYILGLNIPTIFPVIP